MKKAIGKMFFKDRTDPVYGRRMWSDFEVHSITAFPDSYEGSKVDGTDFHCYEKYWRFEAYPSPRIVIEAGRTYLLNFYDRSGDNWEPIKILFVGKELFVYERDGVESSAYVETSEFRDLSGD